MRLYPQHTRYRRKWKQRSFSILHLNSAIVAVTISCSFSETAYCLDWEPRHSRFISLEGGWISGSKIPITSNAQTEFDNASGKTDNPTLAETKIETRRLRGIEWLGKGVTQFGFEGFSRDLMHQVELDFVASGIIGNSSGSFYNPPGFQIFPHDAVGGRNSGWTVGGSGGLHWIPFSSFGLHLTGKYLVGSDALKSNFNSIDVNAAAELKAARFILKPAASFVRLTSVETLPAADVVSWFFDIEWLGNEHIKFKNPSGYPLIKKISAAALGSNLLVKAMENEGSYLELNFTPRLQITRGLILSSHFRSLSGTGRSYIAPSLAIAIADRARKTNDWTPPEASAEYTSQTFEWKNTLTKKIDRGFHLSLSVLYTSRGATYVPGVGSTLKYSALLDRSYESSIRYFLGSEFLL